VNEQREFWTQDNNGRDTVVAITYTADDAAVVWDAIKRARAYVEEREHRETYRGRFIRSWDEQDGVLWRSDLEERGVSLS
jgi:hypothetical protein